MLAAGHAADQIDVALMCHATDYQLSSAQYSVSEQDWITTICCDVSFPQVRRFRIDAVKGGPSYHHECRLCLLNCPMQPPTSAVPDFYYALFAFYEPALTIIGFIGTLCDPKSAHNAQAPWPAGSPPPPILPKASIVTVIQLAHVCALMGLLGIFILTAVRKHLASHPALQEKIVRSLLVPLLIGDVSHLYLTLWALGDDRWDVTQWTPMLWATVVTGVTLMIPRVMWHLGIWRYVDARDRAPHPASSQPGSQSEKS
ncbi:hypothetical protein J3R82DRAFT_4354 [Butyriboletus roseoflavus]|nr:hypothetical protein J3R82DRAFT_4354 [Butyriboletus roseoflavus]